MNARQRRGMRRKMQAAHPFTHVSRARVLGIPKKWTHVYDKDENDIAVFIGMELEIERKIWVDDLADYILCFRDVYGHDGFEYFKLDSFAVLSKCMAPA